jgi:hypothetical protein
VEYVLHVHVHVHVYIIIAPHYTIDTSEKDQECSAAIGTPRMGIVAKTVYKYAKAWFQNVRMNNK